ncbi:MAG: hypothetical protein ACXV2A_02325 [Halobacteriota archaeon]
MIKKVTAIVVLVIVASLSIAGCIVNTPASSQTPTSTPTPTTDYSSYFDKWFEGGNAIMELCKRLLR